MEPLPPATEVKFDFSALARSPHDLWYRFEIDGRHVGFEHAMVSVHGDLLTMRREVAFDGGEQWGVNHFDVSVAVTTEPRLRLVSFRFENPIAGYLGVGKVEGVSVLRFETNTRDGERRTVSHALPGDLPAIPSYLVETLACFMPLEGCACFHYRPITDGDGTVGRASALFVFGPEFVDWENGVGSEYWRVESRAEGGVVSSTFWRRRGGHVVRSDYSGAVAVASSKKKALEDLHEAIHPQSTD